MTTPLIDSLDIPSFPSSSVPLPAALLPPHVVALSVRLVSGRHLLAVDDRDDGDAVMVAVGAAGKNRKRSTGGAAIPAAIAGKDASNGLTSGKGAPSSSSQDKTPLDVPASASLLGSGTKPKAAKKGAGAASGKPAPPIVAGGAAEDEELHYPFFSFITYTPFEPILIDTPSTVAISAIAPTTGSSNVARKNVIQREVDDIAGSTHAAASGSQLPPSAYAHRVLTPLSDDSTSPSLAFNHTQYIANREHLMDSIVVEPLVFTLWQYLPSSAAGADGGGIGGAKKKKLPTAPGGMSKDGSASSASIAIASTVRGAASNANSIKKKAKRGANVAGNSEEEELALRTFFGEFDPESSVKIGEIHVDCSSLLQASTASDGSVQVIEGWFPVRMNDDAMNAARSVAASRGRPFVSQSLTSNAASNLSNSSSPSPPPSSYAASLAPPAPVPLSEYFVRIELDRPLLPRPRDLSGSNTITIRVERVERMPAWIIDCAQMESQDASRRRKSERADEERATALAAATNLDLGGPGGGSRPLTGENHIPSLSFGTGVLASTNRSTSSVGGGGGGGEKDKDKDKDKPRRVGSTKGDKASSGSGAHNAHGSESPDGEWPDKDYTDSFALVYNLPLSASPWLQKSVRPGAPVASVGWSESQRRGVKIGTGSAEDWSVLPWRKEQALAYAMQQAHAQAQQAGGMDDPLGASSNRSMKSQGAMSERDKRASKKSSNTVVNSPAMLPTSSSSASGPTPPLLLNSISSTGDSSGSTPNPAPLDSARTMANILEVATASAGFQPSLSRASLVWNHSRVTFLSAEAVDGLKVSIAKGAPFVIRLEHTRAPLESDGAKPSSSSHDAASSTGAWTGGKLLQSALALCDLRPLMKPGALGMDGYFAVRQTSAPWHPRPLEESGKKTLAKRTGASTTASSTMIGTAAAAAAITGANKRSTVAPDVASAGSSSEQPIQGQSAVVTPLLETFDESRAFIRVSITLAKPFQMRRAKLKVADVLADAADGADVAKANSASKDKDKDSDPPLHLLNSFLGTGAHSRLAYPSSLVTLPRHLGSPSIAKGSVKSASCIAPSRALDALRSELRIIVKEMVDAYSSSAAAADGGRLDISGTLHSIPSSSTAFPNSFAPSSPLVPLLSSSSLSLHFLSRVRPLLCDWIESRFFVAEPSGPSSSAGPSDKPRSHAGSRNEMMAELSLVAAEILREELSGASSGSGANAKLASLERERAGQRSASDALAARHANLARLAQYAEQDSDLSLASLHHTTRLTSLLALPLADAASASELVRAWYEYGAFLLRRQNAPGDLSALGEVRFGGKSGSLPDVANAMQIGEECMQQCIRYDPYHVPALVALALINLERDDVEHSAEYVHRALQLAPNHALLLAIQGLYHDLAEEDDESAGAMAHAQSVLYAFIHDAGVVQHDSISLDRLIHDMIGEHATGAYALPLLHSQSVQLLLGRYLTSQGFARLAFRVLAVCVRSIDSVLDDPNSEQVAHYGYAHYGPYLEMARWHSLHTSSTPDEFDAYARPLLHRVQDMIDGRDARSSDPNKNRHTSHPHHHSHSSLYTLGMIGNIWWENGYKEQSKRWYQQYQTMLEREKMIKFLDPLVLSRASLLFLTSTPSSASSSLHLSTLLCSHPSHRLRPSSFVSLSSSHRASSDIHRSEEALAEAIALDPDNAASWSSMVENQLERIDMEIEMNARGAYDSTPSSSSSSSSTYAAPLHSFSRVLALPLSTSTASRSLMHSLVRLWSRHGFDDMAREAWMRAGGDEEREDDRKEQDQAGGGGVGAEEEEERDDGDQEKWVEENEY